MINKINPGQSSGNLYNFWGLFLLLVFGLIFQLIFYFGAIALCSGIYGVSFAKAMDLAAHPDGTTIAVGIARISNLVTFVGFMLFPALLFTVINRSSIAFEGGLQTRLSPRLIGWSIIIVILSAVVVSFLDQTMRGISWPSAWETYIKQLDDSRQNILNGILRMNGIPDLIICIFILAFLPAFLEELLFRGIILNILKKMSGNAGLAILLQACIFTLLHLSFYEFFAILFMGILFGIIAYRTKTIWYTIIMHFVFNSITVIATYFDSLKTQAGTEMPGLDKIVVPWYYCLPAFAIIYIILKTKFLTLPSTHENV